MGPSPLAGPTLQQAGLAGSLTVGVAANARQLQIQVYAATNQEAGTRITARVHVAAGSKSRSLVLVGCGPGCASGPLVLPSGSSRLSITTTAPGWKGGTFSTSLVWPPPPLDPGLLEQLVMSMRSLPSLTVTEEVTTANFHTAPRTVNLSGAQFMADEIYVSSDEDDLSAPTADNVRPLPAPQHGLSFNLGQGHLWATIWLDSHGRMSREQLINAGNEIDRKFSYPQP